MSSHHHIPQATDSPMVKQSWCSDRAIVLCRAGVIITIVVGLIIYWFPASARPQETQKPKKAFTVEDLGPLEHKREIVEWGQVTFHTNANRRHKETIVEVSVIDKSGRTIASLPVGARALGTKETNRALGLRSNSELFMLDVEANYEWEGAKGAKCEVSIKNPTGVKRNDHWSFDYEIVIWATELEDRLACSDSKIDLYSAPNKRTENSESAESILKEN